MRAQPPASIIIAALAALALWPAPAQAMHISDAILPPAWAAWWFLVSAPFVLWGLREISTRAEQDGRFRPLVGLVGAAVFIISCMPIPVPGAGSCSHPCGTGLAAILIGPAPTVVVASVALFLQALFLAHGGFSTLGANVFSMGVAGAFAAWGVFWVARRVRIPILPAAFLAGLIADWATYTATSFSLATALGGETSWGNMFLAILVAFMPTQIPLGVAEGIVTMLAYRFVHVRRPELLELVLKRRVA